jgi:CRP-like cAMP-binding protein
MTTSPEAALETALGALAASRIRPYLSRRDLAPGDVVMRYGELADSLYLVVDGELVATSGEPDALVTLGPVTAGQWLGEINVIDGGPATATVTATTPAVILGLDRATLSRFQADEPKAFSMLLSRTCRDLAARMRRSTEVLNATLVPTEPHERQGFVARLLGLLIGSGEHA